MQQPRSMQPGRSLRFKIPGRLGIGRRPVVMAILPVSAGPLAGPGPEQTWSALVLAQGRRELRPSLVDSDHASVSFCEFELQELDSPQRSPWKGIEGEQLRGKGYRSDIDY